MDLYAIKTVSETEVNGMIKNEIVEEFDVKEENVQSIHEPEAVLHDFAHKVEFTQEFKSRSIDLPDNGQTEVVEDEICVKEEILDQDSSESPDSSSGQHRLNFPLISVDKKHEKRFICIFCNKPYNYLSHLKKHMRTHSGEKPYTCDNCYKDFRCKGTLKVHLLTHTGYKPFKCKVCEKEFQTSSNLKKHSLTHTGDKPYVCDVCHRKYRCNAQMKNHRMQHFGEKKYHCSFCDDKFSFPISLKTHLLKHTGAAPPFKCDICDKNFKMSHHLKRHKESHVGAPFVCRKCDAQFLQLRESQKHSLGCVGNMTSRNLDHR